MPLNVTFNCKLDGSNQIVSGNNRQSIEYSTENLTNEDAKCSVKLTSFTQASKRRISMPPKDCSAVEVRRMRYSVGRGRKAKVILSGINMTVREGAIYGLLGPSGSGKTTLLKSVVGQIKPNEGYVKVFGFQPNQPGSQIPGPAVGYMPQELALYEDFTIKEILWYFGRLYKVPRHIIKERIRFLLSFLDLPGPNRQVLNLSGGQKRRVSLASALVHSPPLLILDEPTVGVDPLLRQSIWKHLVTLTQTERITVIVTTHYIEEASRANIVGLMRRGRLLAENNPADLLAKHNSATLEDVFLKLCVTDTMRRSHELASISMKIAIMDGQSQQRGIDSDSDKTRNQSPSSNQSTSAVKSESTTIEAGSIDDSTTSSATTTINDEQKLTLDKSNNSSVNHNTNENIETNSLHTQCHRQKFGTKLQKKIKSILRINPSNLNTIDGDDIADDIDPNQALKDRRQSGTQFIQQLISELNDSNQQQQNSNNKNNLHELITCDTGDSNGIIVTGSTKKHDNASGSEQQIQSGFSMPSVSYNDTTSEDSNCNSLSPTQSTTNDANLLTTVAKSDNKSNKAYFNPSFDSSNELCNTFNHHSNSGSKSNPLSPNNFLINSRENISKNHEELDPELFLDPQELSTMSPGIRFDYRKQSLNEYCGTIKTITWKNYTRLKRNKPLLLFQFLLPAIQVVLFCICVGNDPFDIPVAIVNEESSADSVAALSPRFLQAIDSKLAKLVYYTDLNTAIQSVHDGKNWGVVHIPENFTISIHKRFKFDAFEENLDDVTIENSTIKVYPDMTNQPIGHAMEVAFRQAYGNLARATADFIGVNPALSEPPIRMEKAIYGQLHMQNYLQYMSPGVLISISYIMATGLTSLAFIIERRDGSYDRTLAAGVDQIQMLLSHAIVQLVVMVVQISLVVFFTFVIYKVPTNGHFHWVFMLLLLQGLAGMSFGLMVSSICTEENTAIMMILGTFYPNLLLAGVIWPIEAIPYWLRWFSYLQPQTLPTQALRNLIVRGWSIERVGVWSGFAVTTCWLLVFLLISCITFRIRR